MKKYAIILPLLVGAVACTQPSLKEQLATLQAEKEELQATADEKDQSLAEFVESFTSIEQNLAEIRERELNINLNNSDENLTDDVHKRVAEDIRVINDLMIQNKKTIEELNAKIAGATGKNSELRRALEKAKQELTAQIEEREVLIAELKENLETKDFTIKELNSRVDTLTLANTEKQDIILDQTTQLQTAFYAMGTSKELMAENILTKDGGFLGLGKSEKLKDDFNSNKFNKIDITATTTIPLSGKKVEIITNHPSDSYVLEGDTEESLDRLVIVDPNRFWNSSKYLVVVLN